VKCFRHSRVDVTISSDFSHHQTLSGRNNERATGYPTLGSLSRTRSAKVAGFVPHPSHTTFVCNFDGHLVSWRPAPSFRTPFPITYHAAGAGSKRLHDIRQFYPLDPRLSVDTAFVSTSHQKVVLELDFAGALWVSTPLCWRAVHGPHTARNALRDIRNYESTQQPKIYGPFIFIRGNVVRVSASAPLPGFFDKSPPQLSSRSRSRRIQLNSSTTMQLRTSTSPTRLIVTGSLS